MKKVICYSYLLHFSEVTCYSYCYILKVTSYFTSYFITWFTSLKLQSL